MNKNMLINEQRKIKTIKTQTYTIEKKAAKKKQQKTTKY